MSDEFERVWCFVCGDTCDYLYAAGWVRCYRLGPDIIVSFGPVVDSVDLCSEACMGRWMEAGVRRWDMWTFDGARARDVERRLNDL